MKKTILSIIMLASATLSLHAQDVEVTPMAAVQPTAATIGYFSYNTVFESMPDYVLAQRQIEELREKYEAEMQRVKDEFNEKYEAFLEGQKDFPATILKKRQTELQELMNKNIAFREESKRLLAEAEKAIKAPLRNKLTEALNQLGAEMNLVVILNTDSDACPYINPSKSVNLTQRLNQMLQ